MTHPDKLISIEKVENKILQLKEEKEFIINSPNYKGGPVGIMVPFLEYLMYLRQLADTIRNNEAINQQWKPILFYLQDNPGVIGANVGDSISTKLLDFLKNQSNKHSD